MALNDVNLIGVLVAVVAAMVLGAAWYGVLANPWMRLAHPGKTKEDLQRTAGPGYLVAAVGWLVAAFVLAAFMAELGTSGAGAGAGVGFLAWAGFVATALAINYAFAQNPWKLYLIDSLYFLVSLVAMGAVIGFMG